VAKPSATGFHAETTTVYFVTPFVSSRPIHRTEGYYYCWSVVVTRLAETEYPPLRPYDEGRQLSACRGWSSSSSRSDDDKTHPDRAHFSPVTTVYTTQCVLTRLAVSHRTLDRSEPLSGCLRVVPVQPLLRDHFLQQSP